MSVLYWREPDKLRRPPTTRSYVGLTIFVVSFALPSISLYGTAEPMPGWACALMAFFGLNGEDHVSPLAVFGGLINPLSIAYIVLRIRDRAPGARWFLTIGILAFMPLMWLSLLMMHLEVRIGHIAWIAALLLIIDWSNFRSNRGRKDV